MTSWSTSTEAYLEKLWYGRHPLALALTPISWLYRAIGAMRRATYSSGLLPTYESEVPVVIVGNISVGGVGKTPLVIWLVKYLRSLGYAPGVVARGYRGRAHRWPQQVRADSDPAVVGDEPIIIARRARCPVAVGPNRGNAVDALVRHEHCDIVISDDGLQHYALARNFEIAVLDGVRRLGNGRCLPAGPLREPPNRLESVDLIVTNGIAGRGEFAMRYLAEEAVRINDGSRVSLAEFTSKEVHAIAGIGNPERFFNMLRSKGIRIRQHRFSDHARYTKSDVVFDDELPVLMTEKDAVKCEHFGVDNLWYVPVDAQLPEVFVRRLSIIFGGQQDG